MFRASSGQQDLVAESWHNYVVLVVLCCVVGVRVVVPPMSQSLNNSDTLLLTCVVSGSEPISYQWLKDGMLVEEGESVSGINTSMLRIDPVSGFNFGGYQCIASNDVDQVLSEVAMVAGECSVQSVQCSPTSLASQCSWTRQQVVIRACLLFLFLCPIQCLLLALSS